MIKVSLLTAIIDILTLVISSFFFIQNIKRIKQGANYLIGIIVFVLYLIPLYIDYLYMMPDYTSNLPGFVQARNDTLVNIIFDILFVFLQYKLLYHKKKNDIQEMDTSFVVSSNCRILLYIGMLLAPLIVVVFIRQPFMLYTFGWRELGIIDPPRFYDQAEQFCYFSSACSLLLFFEKGRKPFPSIMQKIISAGFLYISLSIQGKRAILFFVMICICILLYFELLYRLKNKKSWRFFLIYIIVLGVVAAFYMFTISLQVKVNRGITQVDTNEIITGQRVDFFRDDRVRMSIFSEVHPDEMTILQYRGQTLIPDMFGVIPLNYLRDRIGVGRKIYQTYFTCGLTGDDINSKTAIRDSNWMTVTCIAEIISNFSIFLAFFIIPFLFIKVSKLIDKLKYPFNILTVFAFVLINLFDTTYVVVFIEFELIFYLLLYRKKVQNKI